MAAPVLDIMDTGKFLSSYTTGVFSRKAQLPELNYFVSYILMLHLYFSSACTLPGLIETVHTKGK
jgi:hypothetical protein